MSNIQKSRTFLYNIDISNNTNDMIDESLEQIKEIPVKYHIIGFDKNNENIYSKITGFIWFTSPRAITSIRKLLKNNSVEYAEEDSFTIHKRISEMDSFWETGILPKQKHIRKKSKIDETILPLCNYLIKENSELKEKLLDFNKYLRDQNTILIENSNKLNNSLISNQKIMTSNTLTNSNNNSNKNNKIVNINMFLNEQCKDAITLTDFVKNIQIQNDDLFYAKDHGYAEAVVRILNNSLKQYDVTSRPLHCTDIKRETMHIKNEEGWVKEKGSQSENINKALDSIAKKKMDRVSKYIQNEGKTDYSSPKYEENIAIMTAVSNGASNKDITVKKIVKGITPNVKLENDTNE